MVGSQNVNDFSSIIPIYHNRCGVTLCSFFWGGYISVRFPDFIAGRLSTSFMDRYVVEKKTSEGSLAESA